MKEAIIKFVFNLLALALYVVLGTIGFYYGGFALPQAFGFGFLFGLILGCLNELRRDIWEFRKLFEKKDEPKEDNYQQWFEKNKNKQLFESK